MQRHELEQLNREELIAVAERFSVPRPRVLTQPELIDEILMRTAPSKSELARSRGWFGRARDLLASVVERGLHLPEVARVLRATPASRPMPTAPTPLATVTLAEIYAAQGHLDRAIFVLDEVLLREPAHEAAHKLRERFLQQTGRAKAAASEPELQPSREEPVPPAAPVMAAMEAEEVRTQPLAGDQPQAEAPRDAEPQAEAPRDDELQPQALAASEPQPETVVERAPGEPEMQAADSAEPAEPVAAEDRSAEDVSETSELPETPAEAPAELGPATLPVRYNVDEVVAIAVDPTTLYFYWEVRPTTLARLRAAKPTGALIARLVVVVASWEGPQVQQRDIRIDLLYGDHTERGVPSGSQVRLSVGWLSGAEFDPIAVGAEVEVPRALATEFVAQRVGRWTNEPGGLPLQPAGDYGLHPAIYAPAQRPMGQLTSAALSGPAIKGLSAERLVPGAGPSPVGGTASPLQGGSSELVRAAGAG